MPRRTPGTDNRVLRVCGLLNRHRVRYLREGLPFDVTLRAAQPPRYVKVIVYDYAADLLGSAIVKLK